jgi:hypothetical protein
MPPSSTSTMNMSRPSSDNGERVVVEYEYVRVRYSSERGN